MHAPRIVSWWRAVEERAREEEQAASMAEGLPLPYYANAQRAEIGRLLEPPPLPSSSRSVRGELRADRSVAFRVFRRDGYRCVYCGSDGTEPHNDLTVDHVLPVSMGGTNDVDNLQTLCRRCNSRKGCS